MNNRKSGVVSLTVQAFDRQQDWAGWLERNHETSPGIWLQLVKKGVGIRSVTYDEAVETALCFGWIDGQKRAHSEHYWLQKFTRRSDSSVWSKRNKEKALALIDKGYMRPAGLAAIERARRDGRWDAAYDSASKAGIPADFQAALERSTRAREFFSGLDARNRYAVLYRIQTAKRADTRARLIVKFVQMLERHETIHP